MPSIEALQVGRRYSGADIEALEEKRRPRPAEPFTFDAPAPRQGVGNTRRSEYGDKWCAYCQTPLARSCRGGTCDECRDTRDEVRERLRGGSRAFVSSAVEGSATPLAASSTSVAAGRAGHTSAVASDARQQNWDDLQSMLDAVSRLSEVVGMASAQRYRNGGMKSEDVEDMLFACKDVMVAADPLRRRLRHNGR
jgi:hypothetical protein